MQIELKHIHKRFGAIHANDDINLLFDSGRIVGILGENGAGKSTLMKILSGFQRADSGEIWLDGKRSVYHGPLAAIEQGIGMLQQDPLDVGAFTVLENFIYGQSRGIALQRSAARAKLEQISQRFGFALDPDAPVAQLSIGQRQQLEIVRLLALGMRTLILDEPTTGISAEQKALLFGALRELATHDSVTILLVSHKLEDVIALCDEVAVLRAGQLVGAMDMPATTQQLVTLMFGEELAPPNREPINLDGNATAVALDGVLLRGQRVTVENLSLRIKTGEIIGLAGLDGSGQELLLRACAGLTPCHRGRITIAGREMTGKSYQDFLQEGVSFGAAGRLEEGLVSGLTLTEHVALSSEFGRLVNWERACRHTHNLIKQYNVRGRPESQVETLSGGNQQRLLIGMMREQAKLLVLEQPTRGLDVDSARWIWQQLVNRCHHKAAVLFSSPDLDELVAYSDRILVFYAGRVTEVPATTSIDDLGRLIGGEFE
jgi:simple sugar transport system ATP-binding protein